jgi:hypothetical protein
MNTKNEKTSRTSPRRNENSSDSLAGRRWLIAWLAVAAALVGHSLWRQAPTPRELASASSADAALIASTSPAVATPTIQRTFRAIDELRVGDRVVADNPDVETPVDTEVDPKSWRLLRLYAEERWPDGTLDTIHIETLQSPEWIELWGAKVGADVPPPLDLVEMGLSEGLKSTVVANEPCPRLQPGPGRLVLTTVNHLNPDVWELTAVNATGVEESLRPTGFHKFYSETRRDWVSTKEIHDNEVIRGRAGPLTIVAKRSLPGVERVYNLTVEGEHVYYVSELGLLAHNTCVVYRELSAADRARLDAGLGLQPKGNGGSIADQVAGRPTKYTSASKTVAGTSDYSSGHGLVAIDVQEAIRSGGGYVDHNNVLQAVRRGGIGSDLQNAIRAEEVLFKGEIPASAIRFIRKD